jgi:hypothetical protein
MKELLIPDSVFDANMRLLEEIARWVGQTDSVTVPQIRSIIHSLQEAAIYQEAAQKIGAMYVRNNK